MIVRHLVRITWIRRLLIRLLLWSLIGQPVREQESYLRYFFPSFTDEQVTDLVRYLDSQRR